MTAQPSVFIVDDDSVARETMRSLVESVGLRAETFASAQAFLDAYDQDQPGCLVTDLRMPGMSGLELQSKLAADEFNIPVIVVTGYPDVPTAVRSIKTGAIDFVEKPFNEQMLIEQIQQSIQKDRERRRERAAWDLMRTSYRSLTPREQEVMSLVVRGKSNKEMARLLDISPKTIEAHRSNVMGKMQAKTLADLIRTSDKCIRP